MAKYRPIKTCFWDDEYIIELKTDEKLFFLFLLTNANTTLCGIYKLSIGYAYRMTAIRSDRLSEILLKFQNDGKIAYFSDWILVKNYAKHQTASPKIKQGIERELSEIPLKIKENLYRIDTVSIATDKPVLKLKPILNISTNVDSATHKSYGNEEINKLLAFIKAELSLSGFTESSKMTRVWGANLLKLAKEIGKEEFVRRFKDLASQDFYRQNMGSLQFVYKRIKGYVSSSSESSNIIQPLTQSQYAALPR